MKNRKNSSTGDLEAVSLVAGVILVLCFGMMIFDLEAAPVFMTLVIAMGVIMNGTAALERFYRERPYRRSFYSGVRGASAALCAASVLAGLRIYEK